MVMSSVSFLGTCGEESLPSQEPELALGHMPKGRVTCGSHFLGRLLFFVFFFRDRAGLELPSLLRLALNLGSSCLRFPSAA